MLFTEAAPRADGVLGMDLTSSPVVPMKINTNDSIIPIYDLMTRIK